VERQLTLCQTYCTCFSDDLWTGDHFDLESLERAVATKTAIEREWWAPVYEHAGFPGSDRRARQSESEPCDTARSTN